MENEEERERAVSCYLPDMIVVMGVGVGIGDEVRSL